MTTTMTSDLIAEPKVFLVGKSALNKAGLREFLAAEGALHWHTDANDSFSVLSELAGRVCYMSFERSRPGGNEAYLERIIESGHGSVLEHTVFNFIITGVSRGFSHELVRHRIGVAYSQLSTRYVDESAAKFVIPPILDKEDHLTGRTFIEHYKACRDLYEQMVPIIMTDLKIRSKYASLPPGRDLSKLI